jgi:hypothetical protein
MTAAAVAIDPASFRAAFALALVDGGGVLVDVRRGGYFRLNRVAAAVCAGLQQAGPDDDVAAAVAARLGVPRELAAAHLVSLSGEIAAAEAPRAEPIGPFRYRLGDGGYELWHGQRCVLRVDGDGGRLALLAPARDLSLPLLEHLRAIAPKILFLKGVNVLHGASCVQSGRLLGLCGVSGAGKTTTARALARHGADLIGEDLMLLGPDPTRPTVVVGGEAAVHAWAAEMARALAADCAAGVDTAALPAAAATPTQLPLDALWFLDAGRRGGQLALRRLSPLDALVSLMQSNFLGAADAASWRRHLAVTSAVATAVPAFDLDPPDGLDLLDGAVARYTTNSAS